MSKNLQNYFTTGELSQLCKIPRKTLLYYDKLGLITPELVDENDMYPVLWTPLKI